jgi:hypothetical protein
MVNKAEDKIRLKKIVRQKKINKAEDDINCTPCQGHFKKEEHLIFGHIHVASTLILDT